jgi:hypothetical protein
MKIFAIYSFVCLFAACYSQDDAAAYGWELSTDRVQDCDLHKLCTTTDPPLVWRMPSPSQSVFINSSNFYHKNIHLSVHGDSYMRHLYEGLAITFSGDYELGALIHNLQTTTYCRGEYQFVDTAHIKTAKYNHCALNVNRKTKFSNGVSMAYVDYIFAPDFKYMTMPNKQDTIEIISFGNHGYGNANNATAMIPPFRKQFCEPLQKSPSATRFFFVSTHYRLRGVKKWETVEIVEKFNNDMKKFIQEECSPVVWVDVYNMTRNLGVYHLETAKNMTFDQVVRCIYYIFYYINIR